MNKPDLKSPFWRYYLPVFLLFSIIVLAFQYNREKHYKSDMLDTQLSDSNNMIFSYLESANGSVEKLDSIIKLSPYSNIRVTVIDLSGKVVYDNAIGNVSFMENHINRKEVVKARKNGEGSQIRTSHTNHIAYYYHATRFGNCYIRSSVPFDMDVSALLSPDNIFLYFWLVITFIIITALFYMTNRVTMKQQREQIEHDANIRRQLTQQVAHELKTPLSSIIGYMETLHDNPDISPERQKFFIDRSHSQAVRLSELLQDILLLNQLNEAPRSIEMEPLLINKVVENVLEDVEMKIQEKNFKINTSFGGDVWIKANPILVYSIFRNLIDNSLSYAGENILINITVTGEDAQFYHFMYNDNGTGVKEEHLPFLFDRFYRVDKGRSRKTGGTGLGLSIVKNAVEFHKGTITARTNNGGGLEFIFTLHK
ncbi:MAG: ATP-binding protein [Paludibacter sp.]|nr:ATP-binding protein [Paludibacter sp.]